MAVLKIPDGQGGYVVVRAPAGKQVEFTNDGTYIKWRYVGDVSWTNLIAVADITGPQGIQGIQGEPGWPYIKISGSIFDGREWGGDYSLDVILGIGEMTAILLFSKDLITNDIFTNLTSPYQLPSELTQGDIIKTLNTSSPIYPYIKKITFNINEEEAMKMANIFKEIHYPGSEYSLWLVPELNNAYRYLISRSSTTASMMWFDIDKSTGVITIVHDVK